MIMATKKKPQRQPASEAILMLALELLAVGLFTIIAGTNDDMGTLVILFMLGMWLIYLVSNAAVLSGLESALAAA